MDLGGEYTMILRRLATAIHQQDWFTVLLEINGDQRSQINLIVHQKPESTFWQESS